MRSPRRQLECLPDLAAELSGRIKRKLGEHPSQPPCAKVEEIEFQGGEDLLEVTASEHQTP